MPSSERQRAKQRARNLFVSVIKRTLEKPEKLTVGQWAEKYRILGLVLKIEQNCATSTR